MIFYRGDQKSIKAIANLLTNYADCFGKVCNISKSLVYVYGMSGNRHINLAELLGFTMAPPVRLQF